MGQIVSNLLQRFRSSSILLKFIYINSALFVLTNIVIIILSLFNISIGEWLNWLYLPANVGGLIYKPWTLITYMFLHKDIMHLLFNMIWLYWFGSIFTTYFSERTLGGLYILGGIFGAILFILAYNVFPLFAPIANSSILLGASASVLAVVVATAMRVPDMRVQLIFVGSIKLKWIAIAILLLDLLSVTSNNAGGHWAHLGGALAGYIFSIYWKKGKDITSGINRLVDMFVNLFVPRKPKLKVKVNRSARPESDMEYRQRIAKNSEEIDKILDKVKESGYASLTPEEKKRLFDASGR
ncbi:MAG: rhomboid family intramembrane serine protease [Bacteroidales bacterium]